MRHRPWLNCVNRRIAAFAFFILAAPTTAPTAALGGEQALDHFVGAEAFIPEDPRQEHARFVRFRPGDGQTVTLNPPRFSWPVLLEIVPPIGEETTAERVFTLEIGSDPGLVSPEVVVPQTPFNFYNYLAPLSGASRWYWRVGYDVGTPSEEWSAVRSFDLDPDAVVWDRSMMTARLDAPTSHPRMLFTSDNRADVLGVWELNAASAGMRETLIERADDVLNETWYIDFPEDDSQDIDYGTLGRDLTNVAFTYLLTEDARYATVLDRFLTVASWPKGGFSSPEGACPGCKEWSTHLTEYLGLAYDWLHELYTEEERATLLHSLEWRIDATINDFAWRTTIEPGGPGEPATYALSRDSVAISCDSHPYENLLVTLNGALAVYEELEVARLAVDLGLHYLLGITNGFGEDEAWNEGPGYGNSKFRWLIDASIYTHALFPELELAKNEAYDSYTEFLASSVPVTISHSAFGNNSFFVLHRGKNRIDTMRKSALFRGDGVALRHWQSEREHWITETGNTREPDASPWIDYVLPYYFETPEPVHESDLVRAYPIEGWVTVTSESPSDRIAQADAVSMTFQSRPRGGYRHSFRSENAFDLHAYGETIAVGGNNTRNFNLFNNHTMAHNTVLVNGIEQRASGRDADVDTPIRGRLVAFEENEEFVYWAGEAARAYPADLDLERYARHVVFVGREYFVLYDDLRIADGGAPATFQWLYHTTPDVPIAFDSEHFAFDYTIGDVNVRLQHTRGTDRLTWRNLVNEQTLVNPLTGEDFTEYEAIDRNNLWIGTLDATTEHQFVAVIVPWKSEDEPPTIAPLVGAPGAEITFRGETTSISFNPAVDADIVIDAPAIGTLATE